MWSCDPEGVVSVVGNGTLTALERGVTRVYAADVRNTVHFNFSEVCLPHKLVHTHAPVSMSMSAELPRTVLGFPSSQSGCGFVQGRCVLCCWILSVYSVPAGLYLQHPTHSWDLEKGTVFLNTLKGL